MKISLQLITVIADDRVRAIMYSFYIYLCCFSVKLYWNFSVCMFSCKILFPFDDSGGYIEWVIKCNFHLISRLSGQLLFCWAEAVEGVKWQYFWRLELNYSGYYSSFLFSALFLISGVIRILLENSNEFKQSDKEISTRNSLCCQLWKRNSS